MARLVTQLLLVSIVFTIALPNPVPRREGKRHGHRRHRASTEASLLSTTGANTTDLDYDYVATTPETASEADYDVTTEADYTDDDDEDVERSNSGSYPEYSDFDPEPVARSGSYPEDSDFDPEPVARSGSYPEDSDFDPEPVE